MTGYVYRIDRRRSHDGPGLRTTVLLKGCPLRCWWCDVPETHQMEPQFIHRPDACIRCLSCLDDCKLHALSQQAGEPVVDERECRWCGDCADGCPTDARTVAGSAMTESRVIEEIERERPSYEASGGGVTFSGGEPLMQPEFLVRLLEACRARGIHRTVDTCGHAPADVMRTVASLADLILYDVKHLDDDAHRKATGLSNRLILSNLAALAESGPKVIVRFALIPGVNDDEGHVRRLGAYVAGLGWDRIDVLPYRAPESRPFRSMGLDYRPVALEAPGDEAAARVAGLLRESGLEARLEPRA